jgi:glycerophosphoryl diester phosphodiesterase
MSKSKIIAHRGAWRQAGLPQNSLASLERAKELHCDGSELDVHLTADGVVVVNHDHDFYGIPIETASHSELCAVQHPNGENIPKLLDFLPLAKKLDIPLFLEIKSSMMGTERSLELTEKVWRIVDQCNVKEQIHYISFDQDVMRKVLSVEPGATASYLSFNGDLSPEQVSANGWQGIDYHIRAFRQNPQWIIRSRELGLLTNVWTVNEAEEMQKFLESEIDFITTDEPELLLGMRG